MTLEEQLREALLRKDWSITRAAKEADVERSFLNRLMRGGDPPRTRVGRHTAEHDERYHRLAVALELDPEVFVENVRRIQLGEEEVDLADHYPELQEVIQEHLPVRTDDDVRRLLRAALGVLEPEGAAALFDGVFSSIRRTEERDANSRRIRPSDYLGVGGLEEPLDPRPLCERIGDALIGLDDPRTVRPRVKLAALFYELAPSVEASRK